jgi:flagellar biogenesis protein FliO
MKMNEENSEICLERAKKRIVETTMECLNLKEKVAELETRVTELENQVTELGGTERIIVADVKDRELVLGANSKEWVRAAIERVQKKMKPVHVENIKKEMVCLLDDDHDWNITRYNRIKKILKRYEEEDVDLVDLVA